MTHRNTPVLIAGGGASGTFMALLLAQQGIQSLVVETRETPYDVPRAHAVNPRSLEICHSLGLDMRRIRREAASREEAGEVFFLPRLFGPVLGRLPYERQDDGALADTPFPLLNIPQTEFEAILFEAVAAEQLIEVRRGWRWTAFVQSPEGFISTVETPGGEGAIASRYLVGCDGAGSAVRSALGIEMGGDPAVLSCLSIIFRADLRQRLADRPGMLFWCTDPAATGTFLGYHMDRLWSYVQMRPPGPIDMSLYDEAACRRLVLEGAGGDLPDLEILKAVPWTMTSQVADSYGRGGIFLVGDAAHRFPPTGGLGLNTGIQDAHNLAWKLGAVERGEAGVGLLDSYERERRPVALRNADQSLVNAKRLGALADLRCEATVWRNPEAFSGWLAEDRRSQTVAAAIELQREHFDSFGLQLGFAYGDPSEPKEVSVYRRSAAVGHRLPHAWLQGSGARSTLDLIDPVRFTVLAAPATLAGLTAELDRLKAVDLDDPAIPLAWRNELALAADDVLIVRPDAHVAYRGAASAAGRALRDLLEPALERA